MATGSLAVKCGKYYGVISTSSDDKSHKGRRQKWINLEIPEKNGKRAAQKKLNEILLTYDDDEKMRAVTILDILNLYIEDSKLRNAPSTYSNNYFMYKGHLQPYFSNHPHLELDKLTSNDIEKYYQSLRKKGLSESSIARQHRMINAAFNQAMKEKLITENIMEDVKTPSEEYHEANFYDIDQLNELFQFAKGSTIYTEILLATFLGLRRGEILGLQWKNIDLTNRKVKIQVNVTPGVDENGRETVVISEKLKTKKSTRSLILPESLTEYLKDLKKQQDERKRILGSYYNQKYKEFVCVDEMGNLHRPNYISLTFRRMIRKSGLPYISFHDLRHSCATMLISLGFSMKAVQEQLGHSMYTTTANTYAHVYDRTKQEIADKAGSVLPILK
ncbi:MAG: site-specific integrase [Flexilinea sp.]|nr:site-specific integrase [Flexilinea sp.]